MTDVNRQVYRSVDRAAELMKKLLAYSRNHDSCPPCLDLDLLQYYTPKMVEFAGEALRCNTTVEWLDVTMNRNVLPIESLDGILCFIANNPALKVVQLLWLHPEGNGDVVGKLMWEAAQRSRTIERLSIVDEEGLIIIPAPLVFPLSLKELDFAGHDVAHLADEWPAHNQLESLSIQIMAEEVDQMQAEHISNLMLILANAPTTKITHLKLKTGWNYHLIMYMLSPNYTIQWLHLEHVDFQHSGRLGCSSMDSLICGLMASRTTTKLDLWFCNYDEIAVEKFMLALKSNRLAVKDLYLRSMAAFDNEDYRELLQLSCLDSLGLCDDMDYHLHAVGVGLQDCNLSRLTVETEELASLYPELKEAFSAHALTSLTLAHRELIGDEEIVVLKELMTDTNCHFRELILDDCGINVNLLFQVLRGNNNVHTLRLQNDSPPLSEIVSELTEHLADLKTLLSLKIFGTGSVPPTAEVNLVKAASRNWTLECLEIREGPADSRLSKPRLTVATQKQLAALSRRNQLKKQIASEMTKSRCIDLLEAFWQVPDGISLVFWLFEVNPTILLISDAQ